MVHDTTILNEDILTAYTIVCYGANRVGGGRVICHIHAILGMKWLYKYNCPKGLKCPWSPVGIHSLKSMRNVILYIFESN